MIFRDLLQSLLTNIAILFLIASDRFRPQSFKFIGRFVIEIVSSSRLCDR
jgi:hypothetical protein